LADRAAPRSAGAFAFSAELEAAIIESPDDVAPRLVYGDWLQAQGDVRGEWVTLSASIEATALPHLRAAGVAFVERNRRALLGAGAQLLPGMWIGWRAGFIDELRLAPFTGQRGYARAACALLEHPSCRFVRCVALGEVPGAEAILARLGELRPPLLESVLVEPAIDSAPLAELRSLRRLGLDLAQPLCALPGLVELFVSAMASEWVLLEHWPVLEELAIDLGGRTVSSQTLERILARTPVLRRLRLLDARGVDGPIATLTPLAERLELLDLSHCDLGPRGVSELLRWPPHVKLRALRVDLPDVAVDQLRARFPDSAISTPRGGGLRGIRDEGDASAWLSYRVRSEGRAAVRLVPRAGLALYNLGTNHSLAHREAQAVPLLEAAVTLPALDMDTWAWANVALAHERLGHFDDAELFGREGLLRAPREPNFYAIVLDALRRSGRNADAEKLLPRAFKAIDAGVTRHAGGTAPACLLDCLFVLAQAGRHREVLAAAKRHATIIDDKRRPSVEALRAMSLVALGRRSEAREAMQRTRGATHLVVHHARAVMKLDRPADAIAELAIAQAGRYPEWHWVAVDPNLEPLRAHPGFTALVSGAGVEGEAGAEVRWN